MKQKTFYISSFLMMLSLLMYLCNKPACVLPEEYKTKKSDIAILSESQGMITYDVHLREDGKFVCNNDGAFIYGKFKNSLDTIYLFEECDKQNLLCSIYFIDTKADIGRYLLAIPQCDGSCEGRIHEDLWFNWL